MTGSLLDPQVRELIAEMREAATERHMGGFTREHLIECILKWAGLLDALLTRPVPQPDPPPTRRHPVNSAEAGRERDALMTERNYWEDIHNAQPSATPEYLRAVSEIERIDARLAASRPDGEARQLAPTPDPPYIKRGGSDLMHAPDCNMVTGKGMGLSENIIVAPKCSCAERPVDGEARPQEPHTWNCGCGHTNGCNLAICAACGRGPGASR